MSVRPGNPNPGGMTPTIVTARWPNVIVRPIAPGEPPKRRRQNSWLITAAGASLGDAVRAMRRPASASTPKTSKNSGVTSTTDP